MNKKQATAMLIAHCRTSSSVISEVKSEIIRTTQIFLKICSLVRDCFHVCGVKELLVKVYGEDFQQIPILNYYKRSISVYNGLYYADLMQREEFRGDSLHKEFDKKQVERTLKNHMQEAEDSFVEACCKLLTKY